MYVGWPVAVTESHVNALHVHSGNIFGGVERMLETLAPATAGSIPLASSYALCFEGRVSESLRAAGAAVHHLGPVRGRRVDEIWRARRRLRSLLQQQGFDVVVVHSSWSQAIFGPTTHRTGTPLVRWFHAPGPGPGWLELWARRSRPALALYNSRYTWNSARAHLADVPSEIHYPPARCVAPALASTRARARAAIGAPDAAVVIVMASRLEPLKGHRLLIEALARLSPSADWQAWIVGGAQGSTEMKYSRELERSVTVAGLSERVRFLGERSDVAELLHAADVYCQPNVGPDAFGFSFVEALAAGLPVVTARLGAAPEIVNDGCGILVEPGSVDALVTALATLLSDRMLRVRLGANGRTRAADFCDLPNSLSRLASSLGAARLAAVSS